MPVLLPGQVPDEAPIAAGINLDVLHILLGDHHICLVPKRQDRHVAADDILNARVKLFCLLPIESVDRFIEQGVQFLVAVAAAIS